jgi:hypothetical protein
MTLSQAKAQKFPTQQIHLPELLARFYDSGRP